MERITEAQVRKIVLDIIAEIAPDTDCTNLKDARPLKDQLGLDSMDFLDIVMELRKKHQIDIPEKDYPQLETMQSCIHYLMPKFNAHKPSSNK